MRAFGLPVARVLRVGVLRVAIGHQTKVFNGAGENEFIDEENDGFSGEVRRRPFDLVEFIKPDFEVFKELAFQFGFVRRVFQPAHGVKHAAGFAATVEKVHDRQFGKMFAFKEKVARAEAPRRAEVGEHKVFVVAQIFFDLSDMVFRVGVAAPEGVRAVALEERFKFEGQRHPHRFRQHEIHEAFHHADLTRRLKAQQIFAKRSEQIFGGGFRLCVVL